MRTWSATFLASFVMGLFAYVTFIKENPVSSWWWVLAIFILISIFMHDADDIEYQENEEENEEE
jgi:hypothetical protein